jgi:hypothetical protein
MPGPVGTWRSLVAYLNGVQGVPGSNPGVPTNQNQAKTNPPKTDSRSFLAICEVLAIVTFRHVRKCEVLRGFPFGHIFGHVAGEPRSLAFADQNADVSATEASWPWGLK